MATLDKVIRMNDDGSPQQWVAYDGWTGHETRQQVFDRLAKTTHAIELAFHERLAITPEHLWPYLGVYYLPGPDGRPQPDLTSPYGVRTTPRPQFGDYGVVTNLYHEFTLDNLQEMVHDWTGQRRKLRWLEYRAMAAVICTTMACYGDLDKALTGWGVGRSTVMMGASLARVFPSTCEKPELSQQWYWTLKRIASVECGILRPASPTSWDKLSAHAVRLFHQKYRPNDETPYVATVGELKDELKAMLKTQDLPTQNRYDEKGNLTELRIVAWADDRYRVIQRDEKGTPLGAITLQRILEEHGLMQQDIEIRIKPLGWLALQGKTPADVIEQEDIDFDD